MKVKKIFTGILSLCLFGGIGWTLAASPRLHVRQAVSWNRSVSAISEFAPSFSIGYSDCNLLVLGGVRQQAPNTDVGLLVRLGLGSRAWNPDLYMDGPDAMTGVISDAGYGIGQDAENQERDIAYPALLTLQGHYNVQQGTGCNLDLSISAGQELRTRSRENWWGFSYSLGLQTTLSFSPYLAKPLFNFGPTVLLSTSRAFGNRVFLALSCGTNTLFHYTCQITFSVGGSVSVRLSDSFLLGLSGQVRFADLPTESAFISMGEATLFLNWQEKLP